MEHSVEKLTGNKVKISFKATAADFEAAIQKAYLKLRGQINVPGFRKGKAPRKMIESMFGKGVFYEDALEELFPAAYMKAVEENDLKPVSRPELDVQVMEAGKDLEFTAEVFVMPEVKLGEYKGVEVTRTVRKVTEEEVNARLEQERKRVARSVEITDRGLENGDMAELDYSGSVDGVKFDGGTAEHQTLLIGSNTFIPGFEEQMVGMQVGEEKDLNVKFPEQYHAENLKGKDAVFHVKLHAITREELPELDDDFAAEVSDFDTLAEFRADVEKKLQETANAQAEEMTKSALIDKVVANAEIDVPAPMVEDKLDDTMQQMAWRMQQQGFSMQQYMQILGQSEAQMRDMYRAEAESNLRSELVVDEIIKVEGIEADDADVDALLGEYSTAMGQSVEDLKKQFSAEQLDYFKHRAQVNKAIELMWSTAKVTDEEAKPEEGEEKPAKKTTRKKAAPKAEAAEGEETAEAKPKTTRKKAAPKAEAAAEGEEAEKKPATRRRTTKKAAETETGAEA